MSDDEYYDSYYICWDGSNLRAKKIEEIKRVEAEEIDCEELNCDTGDYDLRYGSFVCYETRPFKTLCQVTISNTF